MATLKVSATTLMTKLPVCHSKTTNHVMMTVVPTNETSYNYIRLGCDSETEQCLA